MGKNLSKKKEIILIACILLLLLMGIGIFFMVQNMNKKTALTSEWDISWYDEKEDEYIITTKEQLFGFSELSQTIDFAGKTIKLGNDIVVNEGNAEDWNKKVPKLAWTPAINFAGTFDGQGYSISGLYVDVISGGAGMFADTQATSTIKDFQLVNTYIYAQTSKGTAAISSGGGGTFERIYTDAIVECNGFYCGGIIGTIREEASMTECWFDGAITISGSCAGGITAALSDANATMKHCLNTGTITCTYAGPDAAILGGLCGAIIKTLTVEDCLNVGTVVSEEDLEQVGSLFGVVSGGIIKFDKVWTMKESAQLAIGSAKSGLDGIWGERTEKNLTGFLAYQKTDLDFEKYWAVVEEGTPILQYFADTVPEIPELERALVADVRWYNNDKKEFVIRTAEELLGLTRLTAKGYGNRFKDKTIRLENDIVFNEGDAKDFAEEEPLNEWTPIYNYTGTFDGQGHTISGLYGTTMEGTTTGQGLFTGTREMTVIQNLQVTNSYFTTVTAHGLSAISSRGTGTFKNIYADAILVSLDQGSIGGILGMATKDGVTIENCWSDCEITTGGRRAGGILGNGNGKSKVVIKHCLNTGKITRTFKELEKDNVLRTQSALFGGIVGGTGTGSKGDYKGDFTIEDCLNVGILTSERENDALGGVVGGTTGLSYDGKATVSIKNCYCSESSWTKAIGSKNSETSVYDCIRLDDEMLIGAEAYFYTSLNFKEYWAALSGKTPVLKTFASGKGKTVATSGVRSDISWYTPGKTEYTIKTTAQLYGLSRLAFGGEKFEGVTIKLGADLVINEGTASEWAVGTSKAERSWTPIKNFGGTFDGRGHTISGLYGIATGVHEDRAGIGLFTDTRDTATIQNVSIANSYFESTYANGVGAVTARGGGNFKNIYVGNDVYLQNKLCGSVGAVVGIATKTTTVENCWTAATITAAGQGVAGIVGNGNAQTVAIKHCLNTGTITRSFEGMAESLKLYDYAKYPSYYKDTTEVAGYFGGIIGRTGSGSKGDYKGNFVIEDCLSVGMITSERAKDATGGIAGQTTGNKSDGTPTVTITNSYSNESSCTKIIASQNSETQLTDCVRMKDEMLLGADAYYYTGLNFSDYWAAIQSGTPILATFASGSTVVSVSGTRSDISWYSSDKTEYVITDAADLIGLVRLALGGETFKGKTVKLGATIDVNTGSAADWAQGKNVPSRQWTPIQNFAGTFDGQGCSITGLYGVATGYHADRVGMGLFVETKDTAVIQNLTISNSYLESTYANGLAAVAGRGGGIFKSIHICSDVYLKNVICGSVGGVLGMATKTATVENCWSEAKINSSAQRVGGIVGNGNTQTVTIKHCLNSGTLTRSFAGVEEALKLYDYASYPSYYKDTSGSAGYFGGIIGGTGSGSSSAGYKGNFVIEDCVNVGTITSEREEDANGGIAGHTTGLTSDGKETVTITNAYCTESSCAKAIGSKNSKTKVTNCTRLADDKFSGINAFYNTELDYKSTTNTDGYWSVRANTTPMLVSFLTNSDETMDVSGLSKDEFTLNNNKGYIANLSQLESFRDQMNDGTLSVNSSTVVTLTADIVVNEGDAKKWAAGISTLPEAWTPIKGFGGTFDGDGFTISGLYGKAISGINGIGLFTETKEAIIQNLNITNSYFDVNTTNGTGGLVGCGSGTFKEVYTDVIMSDIDSKPRGYAGGIIGKATGTVTIEDCWSNSTIDTRHQYVGGLIGYAKDQNLTISHCLNTGKLTHHYSTNSSYKTNCYMGGFVGYTNTTLEIVDSMTSGIVQSKDSEEAGTEKELKYISATVGYINGSSATISKSYGIKNHDASGKEIGIITSYTTRISMNSDTEVKSDNTILGLDFVTTENTDGFWTVRVGKMPILTTFFELSEEIDAEIARTTFVLKDNKGTISNLEQLISFRNQMNDGSLIVDNNTKITLAYDIAVNSGDAKKWADGTSTLPEAWVPIKNFSGIFDGGGHTISGIYATQPTGVVGIGLFTETNGAIIQKLNIVNSYFDVNTTNGTGGLVGCGSGTFKEIYTDVIMSDIDSKPRGYAGGIIGKATGAVTIEDCWSNCTIDSRHERVGGMIGECNGKNVLIKHCLNTGNLTHHYSTSSSFKTTCYFGGLVGRTSSTGTLEIEDSLSTGIVQSKASEEAEKTLDITRIAALIGNANSSTTTTNTYGVINYDDKGNALGETNVTGSGTVTATMHDDTAVLADNKILSLDYVTTENADGFWTARENKIPMLTSFLELSKAIDAQ